MSCCDAHHNEYLAAIAGLTEQTISHRTFTPGMRVRCPKAFGNGVQTGVVYGTEQDRHVGLLYLVDTPEGRLRLLPDELEIL